MAAPAARGFPMIRAAPARRKTARHLTRFIRAAAHLRRMSDAHQKVLNALNARAKAAGWTFLVGKAEGFEHPPLAAACALWHEKANGRAMPARADLTARVMKAFMAQMSLLERVNDNGQDRYRVRLHGSALARYSGDATGKWLEDVVGTPRLGSYLGIYDTVLALRIPLRVVSRYQAPELDYLDGESFVAPLSVPTSPTPIILSVTYAKPRKDDINFASSFARKSA